jgi:glycerol uptake facilitator protein
MMTLFYSEVVGTFILILLGNGVVANVSLEQSKGINSGFLAVTFGWAIAVFTGVYISADHSGAHLNPAVTIALAARGSIVWSIVPIYLAAQFCGAFLGSVFVWIAYRQQFNVTKDGSRILAVFCTGPAAYSPIQNLITEVIGTFALMLGVLFITPSESSLGAINALPVSLLVLGIGLGLGGPTGYAINPARDLAPRLAHALLPIKNKADSQWHYAWIPVLGPIIGALVAVLVYGFLMK